MVTGRKKSGERRTIRGSPADGCLRRQLLHLRARPTTQAAVGLQEIGLRTTKRRRKMTHSIALIHGAAAGSTKTSGRKSHLGAVNGSPDPVDGTADIERFMRK